MFARTISIDCLVKIHMKPGARDEKTPGLIPISHARQGRALRGRTQALQRRMAEDRRAADKEETSSFQGNILK
jgi:hypothetical protein